MLLAVAGANLMNRFQGFRQGLLKDFVSRVFPGLKILDAGADHAGEINHHRV